MPYPVFQAGMKVRAHHLRALQWTEVFQTSTRTIQSTTTMQNTELQFSAIASARYRFVLLADVSSGVAMKFNWEVPSPGDGAVDRFIIAPGNTTSGGSGNLDNTAFRVESAVDEIVSDPATNTHYMEQGDITASSSTGLFIFQFAQNGADPGNTSFNSGSRLWFIRVD